MSERPSRDGGRRFGPMSLLLVPLLLAAFVLPSALNVNQSNPSPTLEYAPVPASDNNPPPQIGNLDTLALARTTGLKTQGNGPGDGGGGGGNGLPPVIPPPVIPRTNSSKTCVGNPPRQTEDPFSPPCVPAFHGKNGGATAVGVTATEVRLLFYVKAYNLGDSGSYWDLGSPPKSGTTEPDVITSLRVWQQYFNQRFQAYGRFVRLFVYSGTGGDAESRRADAAANWNDIHPWATVIHAPNAEPYMAEMARHGVLNFTGGLDGGEFISADAYNQVKPYGWGSFASSELKAQIYADYVCRELKSTPTSFDSGAPKPRKFGLWFSTDTDFPEYTRFGQQVQALVNACGVQTIAHSTHKSHFNIGSANAEDALNAVTDWQRQGVTTILHVAAEEPGLSAAAGKIGYFPEIVIADDHFWAGNQHYATQDTSVFKNAVLVTDVPSFQRLEDTYCYQAYHDTSSQGGTWSCQIYPSLLQVFTAIQVAGPNLTAKTVDQGLHAIPAVTSKDPTVPACFYLPGDYTCVKDATLEYWDPVKHGERASYNQGACWRQVDKGARFIAGEWPKEDLMAKTNRAAGEGTCNNSVQGITLPPKT